MAPHPKPAIETVQDPAPSRKARRAQGTPRLQRLGIEVPAMPARGRVTPLQVRRYRAHIERSLWHPITLLQETSEVLRSLSGRRMAAWRRVRFTQWLLERCAPALRHFYQYYLFDGPGFPENQERRRNLNTCIALIEHARLGLNRVLRQEYPSSNRKIPGARDRINEVAFRALELTYWEQRFRALRSQGLPAVRWTECNQIYFGMLPLGVVHQQHSSVPGLPMVVDFNGENAQPEEPAYATLESLYLSIQLFGLLDPISWPYHLLPEIDPFIQSRLQQLKVETDGLLEGEVEAVVYLSAEDNGPPRFALRTRSMPYGSVVLDPLVELASSQKQQAEQRRFLGEQGPREWLGLSGRLHNEDCHYFMDLALKRLYPRQRREARRSLDHDRNVRLYAGINGAYRLLRDRAHGGSPSVEPERHLRDTLAFHSALLAEDVGPGDESKWILVNESRGGMLLRTAEHRYSNPLYVGQLVATCLDHSTDETGPNVGYVNRLNRRGDERYVDIGITKLSGDVEHVGVADPFAAADDYRVPGFILRHEGRPHRLLVPHHSGFVGGAPLRLQRMDGNIPVRLGELDLAQRDFLVFELRAPDLDS